MPYVLFIEHVVVFRVVLLGLSFRVDLCSSYAPGGSKLVNVMYQAGTRFAAGDGSVAMS